MSVQELETDPIDDVLERADRMIELSRAERERLSKELDSQKKLAPLDNAQLLASTHA